MNPPTTPADSTNTSNIPDLEEEVIRLRQKQTETDGKVDEANNKLRTAIGEIASLWQLVEAIQEQMFSTPPHLQCPASHSTSRPASHQPSTSPHHPPAAMSTDLIPVIPPSPPASIPPQHPPGVMCIDVVPVMQPSPPSPIALVATMMLEDVVLSSNPSRQGSTELAGSQQVVVMIGPCQKVCL